MSRRADKSVKIRGIAGVALTLVAALALPARATVVPHVSVAHDVHMTYSRVVIDGTSVRWRVRLFHDDLEKALQAFASEPALRLTSPRADSIFTVYFTARVPLTVNGARVTGRVVQSGRDPEVTDQDMWSYLVDFSARAPVTALSTRVGLLFEHFTDQRNIVTLIKMPGELRSSMYFVRDDAKEQKAVW
jgi:hypothetical protein